MRARRFLQYLPFQLLALILSPGCQAFHQYRPVSVLARDAETQEPIPGANLRVLYPLCQSPWAPWECLRTTNNGGIACLRAAPYGDAGITLEATAQGYMLEEKNISPDAVEAIKAAQLFEDVNRRPVNFVLELYALPPPTIELIVPTGYRGIVTAEIQIKEGDTQCGSPLGQRDFSFVVPADGAVVQVIGPPVLRHMFPLDFRGKYADGTFLSAEAKDQEIGFWWLKTEGKYQYFFVGTRSTYDDCRRTAHEEPRQRHSSAGGAREGHGRRGRGGKQSTPDVDQAGVEP